MKFDNEVRNNFLSDTAQPVARATLRRLRLDFGDKPLIQSLSIGGTSRSDDSQDDEFGEYVWGDSCVHGTSPYALVRCISEAAWSNTPGSKAYWLSRKTGDTLTPSEWDYAAGPSSPVTWGERFRLGLCPASSPDVYYLWFFDASGDIRRGTLTWSSGWTWTATSIAGEVPGFAGAAVHPISETEAMILGYDSPVLWLVPVELSGGVWTIGTKHILYLTEDLTYVDAEWSDAEVSPADSNIVVVMISLGVWGRAFTVRYDRTADIVSQEFEVFPSSQEWGNIKAKCCSLATHNGRLWAINTRQPVASQGTPMAYHVTLVSSPDGLHWRDEYFVAQEPIRGKLLYRSGNNYCWIGGNASVAYALATNRLGYDNANAKLTVSEGYSFQVQIPGISASPSLSVSTIHEDDALFTSGLWETGNELVVEVTDRRVGTYSEVARGQVFRPLRDRFFAQDTGILDAVGYLNRLVGTMAYVPSAAKAYDSPYTLFTNFQFDNGMPRQSLSTVKGTVSVERSPTQKHYMLHMTKPPAWSTVPRSMTCTSFTLRMSFRPEVSFEGVFFLIYYEDEDNFWQAGVQLIGSVHKLVLRQNKGGEWVSPDWATQTLGTKLAVGQSYSMFLYSRPGEIRLMLKTGQKDYDFETGTTSLVFDSTTMTDPFPSKYHCGVYLEEWDGWEGAYKTGTVADSDYLELTANSSPFVAGDVGNWLLCTEQSRQVSAFKNADTVYVDPAWSDRPKAAAEWGLYYKDAKDGPEVWIEEIFAHEGVMGWSVDDIADSILELSGVTRDKSVWTSGTIPALGATSPTVRYFDVEMYIPSGSACNLWFWLTSRTNTGVSAYSGLRCNLDKANDFVTLYQIEGLGSGSTPYQETTTLASHKSAIPIPDSADLTVRFQATPEGLTVSICNRFVAAFPLTRTPGGYIARGTAAGVTCTIREFPTQFSMMWDATESASAALSRLLQGRRAKMIERIGGEVAISRFDSPLGTLGTYSTSLVQVSNLRDDEVLYSLVEMVGAEETAFHLHKDAARHMLRYIREDNPTLETQEEAHQEARRSAALSYERATGLQVVHHTFDPAAEPEDTFTVEGSDYIVERLSFGFLMDTGIPTLTSLTEARLAPSTKVVAKYDNSDLYNSGKVYR